MEMKRLSFALTEVKADDDTRTIEGFASVFNNVDFQKDIVLPGAFAKSIKRGLPVMLWQHDTNQPVGVWDEMEEQQNGLYVKGRLVDTTLGLDAYKLLKAKAIKGMSIGYGTKKYEIDAAKGVRKLIEVDLYEVSLVTFPANEKASVTRVKSAHDNEREFEEFLREAGYSRDAAKIIVTRGFKALSGQREAEAEVKAQQAADAQRLAALINRFKV